jgi:hypothetical protein
VKSVDVTLSRSQAQTLIALLTDALGEPLEPGQRITIAEISAAVVDALTDHRPVVRWQQFDDEHGCGWQLLCDARPFAVARKSTSGAYRCVLVAGPDPARIGDFATLREARAGALAAFTASAGRHLRGA